MPATSRSFAGVTQTPSTRATVGAATAGLVLVGLLASAQTLAPVPTLPLDTYQPPARAQIEEALKAAQARPRDADLSGRLGMLLYANEQYEFAATCFDRARALAPKEPRWPYYLGRTQSNLAAHERAVASLRTALRLLPDYLPARLLLAKALVDAGQAAEGRQSYEAIVREHPAAAEAHYGLGKLEAAAGQPASAVEHLRKACELAPSFGAAHFALARAYRDTGEPQKAQDELELYQKDRLGWPAVPDPHMSAVVSLKTGADAHLQTGVQLARAGRLQEGADEHEAALAVDPTLLPAHVNLIRIYGTLGQVPKAEEHYRAAIALDPNLAETHYNWGIVLTGQGRSAEALEAFRRAVELKPPYADAQNNYAYLLMTAGRLDEAARHYRSALESQPDHRGAHFNLARILVNQGRLDEAIEHLRQTLEPDDEEAPRCTYALGAAYARAGNRAEARRYLELAHEKAKARGQSELVVSIDKDLQRLARESGAP
jgi:protein O-mannosyl-transferase